MIKKDKKQKTTPEAPEDGQFTRAEKTIMTHLEKQKQKSSFVKPKDTKSNDGFLKKKAKRNAEALEDDTLPGFEAPAVKKPKFNENGKPGQGAKPKFKNFDQRPESVKKLEKPNWKEMKKQNQELKVRRKQKDQSGRYDLSVQAKKIWELLRREDTPQEKQRELSMKLYGLVKGHVKDLCFAHDTVRVVECLVACGTNDIRQALFDELKDSLIAIAKSKYSHFLILKFLRYGSKDQRNLIMKSFSGRVVELMKHKIASSVLENAYNDWANASQRALLSQEFYGPEFRHFKDDNINTLEAAIAKYPFKKETFLKNMQEAVQPVIDKGVYNHSLLHRLLLEFLTHCAEADRADLIQALREAIVHMLHTKDGARVAMICLWHGTPKDRKAIVKSFKTHVVKMAQEEHGHMVLLALFDVIDDTKLVEKAIIAELAMDLQTVLLHEHGRKVLFYLIAGRDTTYTHPSIINILKQGDGNAYSKKESELRQKELLEAVSPYLLSNIAEDVQPWITDAKASVLLTATIKYCKGKELLPAMQAIAKFVCVGKVGEEELIVEQAAVHMALKKIIQHDKKRAEENSEVLFGSVLLETLDIDVIKMWLAKNRGAFLFVSMVETEISTVIQGLKNRLKTFDKFISQQTNKGAEILASKLFAK